MQINEAPGRKQLLFWKFPSFVQVGWPVLRFESSFIVCVFKTVSLCPLMVWPNYCQRHHIVGLDVLCAPGRKAVDSRGKLVWGMTQQNSFWTVMQNWSSVFCNRTCGLWGNPKRWVGWRERCGWRMLAVSVDVSCFKICKNGWSRTPGYMFFP